MAKTFEQLDDAELPNESFWNDFAEAVIEAGPAIGRHNVAIRKILTKDRCLDVAARFGAMTDEEVAWMGKKKRRGKPVRIYRAAPIGQLAGFRFHTNIDHALADLPEGTMRAHLLLGEVDVDSIIFRLETDGAKVVIASPDRVRAVEVRELVHPDAVGVEEAENLKKVEEAVGLEESIDTVEEAAADADVGYEPWID